MVAGRLGTESSHDLILMAGYGGDQMIIKTNGNVGIGTINPATKLQIEGGETRLNRSWLQIYNQDVDNIDAYMRFHVGNLAWYSMGIDRSDAGKFKINYGSAIGDGQFVLTPDGNVGIGTASPSEKLTVSGNINMAGAADRRLYMGGVAASTFGIAYDSTYADYGIFYTEGMTDHVSISPNGNATNGVMNIYGNGSVGIGTNSPSNDQSWQGVLDVHGHHHAKMLVTTSTSTVKTGIFSHGTDWNGVVAGRLGTESNHDLILMAGYGGDQVTIKTNGSVGIGTKTPSNDQGWGKVLDVRGGSNVKILATNGDASYKTGMFTHTNWHGGGGFIGTESSHNLHLLTGYTPRISILTNGNVGIGTTNPQAMLAVNGPIHAKEIKVMTSGWSDFVFEKDYRLPSLEEVEDHIEDKGHLPDIPSEAEVMEKGITLGDMNSKLLQKIEELTLYTISQHKEIKKMKQEMAVQNERYKKLEEVLTRQEQKND